MKKHLKTCNHSFLVILSLVVLSAAGKLSAQPKITSFYPQSGPIGATVTINGSGFNIDGTKIMVYFGAVKAKITSSSANQLEVSVPVGATYQPISVLNRVTGLTAYSDKPFIVTFPGSGVIDANTFAPKVDFATGSYPYGIAIGDLDNDGKPDLATANYASNTVSVIKNTSSAGTIAFAPKADFATGDQPAEVAIGDLDGDGKPDLAVVNGNSNSISVFRNTGNTGTIAFAAKTDFPTGTKPVSVAIGDLDGDGKPDLAVTNQVSSTVSVFRNTGNTGTIAFAAKTDFTTGGNPSSIAIGDLDGDGKQELATANYSSNSVSVFQNSSIKGTINFSSFATHVDFTTGIYPLSIAICDLNGDGKPELVTTNNTDNSLSVLKNTSIIGAITSSSFAAKVDIGTGTDPNCLVIGDVDGDGKPDLATSNYDGKTVSVIRNTSTAGAITFTPFIDFTTGFAFSTAIGDLDDDGKPDLVVGGGSIIGIMRNTIPKITATLSLSNLTQPYNGQFREANVTTNPPNLSGVSITYNGSAILPKNAGSYTVTASLTNVNYTAADVSGTLVITKESPEATIPNILSPNGDGVNDVWVAYNPALYAASEVEAIIFDRDGRIVFKEKPYLNNWNGTVEGRPLVANTYYYVVSFGPGTEQAKGFITLVRE